MRSAILWILLCLPFLMLGAGCADDSASETSTPALVRLSSLDDGSKGMTGADVLASVQPEYQVLLQMRDSPEPQSPVRRIPTTIQVAYKGGEITWHPPLRRSTHYTGPDLPEHVTVEVELAIVTNDGTLNERRHGTLTAYGYQGVKRARLTCLWNLKELKGTYKPDIPVPDHYSNSLELQMSFEGKKTEGQVVLQYKRPGKGCGVITVGRW
jgi:hypothetical protein